jgi:hypothetical protein
MPRINTDNYDTVASWNGSQDLFIVEQPDGTKVATPAMVKQYILNDMDEVPTQNSNKLVKSGGVFSTVDDVYSVMGQMGAKNLIPYPYYEQTHEDNGITWTVNGDGTVTANGTATANSTFIFRQRTEQTKFVAKNTSYIMSGCPSGGSNSKYMLYLFVQTQEPTNITSGTDYGNGATINMPDQDYYGIYAFARVISGQTVSNLTFKPMLRLASDTDNTYQPYAKTNRQLTEAIGDLSQTGLTGDSVAEQLGAANGQIANVAAKYVSERLSKGSSTTIAAGGYVRVDIPCTKSGYTAVGILEVLGPDTAGAVSLMQFSVSTDGSLVFVYFANNTSSAKTMSDVRVRVLYRKN